jgi:hypothetical protein
MSTEPVLLEKAAIEDWIYGRARPLERMSALSADRDYRTSAPCQTESALAKHLGALRFQDR